MLHNIHKTTSEADRGHQAPRKAAQSLWTEAEQNKKDENRDKGFRDREPSCGGGFEGGEVSTA